MPNTDADSIVRELEDVLLRMHLKLNKCRGQCYDGCSTMSGSKSRIAVEIRSKEERALYTHCYAYSVNLAVGDTKVCSVLKDAIDNIYELRKLVKMPPKRDAKIHFIQVDNSSSSSNEDGDFVDGRKNPTIKLFCHTRWTVRVECISGVIRNFDELQNLWDWLHENCSCSGMKACIRGIKVALEFSYGVGIHLAHLILSHTDNLRQTLQGTLVTAVDAQVVSRACVTTLKSVHSKNEFNLFWNKVKQFAEKHKINEPHLPRSKNIPNRYMIGKAASEHAKNVEKEYRRQYYAAVDSVMTCIKERLKQKDYEMYATLKQLLIKAIISELFEEELQKVLGFYHDDFNDDILREQLRTLPAVIGQEEESVNTFHDIRTLVKHIKKPIRNLISEVVKMIRLVIVMPATYAVSERSFSTMRRLYTILKPT